MRKLIFEPHYTNLSGLKNSPVHQFKVERPLGDNSEIITSDHNIPENPNKILPIKGCKTTNTIQ